MNSSGRWLRRFWFRFISTHFKSAQSAIRSILLPRTSMADKCCSGPSLAGKSTRRLFERSILKKRFQKFLKTFLLTVFKFLHADKSGHFWSKLSRPFKLSNLLNFSTVNSVRRLWARLSTLSVVKSSICRGYRARRFDEASSERSFVSFKFY